MKSSRVILAFVAALLLSIPAWPQTSNAQQNTSATASATGQQGTFSSGTAQENTPRARSGENTAEPNGGENPSGIPNSSAATMLHGCVTGGSGTYVLVSDGDGAAYTLMGHGAELNKQINHEVEVTGTKVAVPPTTQPSGHESAAGVAAQPSGNNFQVTSVREITDHCPAPSQRK